MRRSERDCVGASNGSGIGFLGLLALLFIALKLTGYVAWSWWWVLTPLWAPVAIIVSIIAVVFVAAVIAEHLKG